MTGRTYITMYIMWDGPGFPTDLIVSFATTAGEPLPDVTLSYVDFFDDMAVYEFGGDPDLTEQLYEFFRANVGNFDISKNEIAKNAILTFNLHK